MKKYKFKPPTDNVIFYDSEFSSSNPYKGEVLSVGMVTEKGKEFYVEIEHKGPSSKWVEENILPTLNAEKVSRVEAREQIRKFIGGKKPHMIAHFCPYDYAFLSKLFETNKPEELPFNWIPIDMMSIFFALGKSPGRMSPKNSTNVFYKEIGVDVTKFTIHNALDDAKLLREVYLKMII